MTSINESTLAKAFELAALDGKPITESNCLDYFKLALQAEIELAARVVEDNRCGFWFTNVGSIKDVMCERVYAQLSN